MKYNNRKTVIDGIEFDSKKEAKRYVVLKDLQQCGLISDLQMQVKYILVPAIREEDTKGPRGGKKRGKLIERECAYFADFQYFDNRIDETVVEDVKGVRTEGYIIKRKLMLYVYGIKIKEV